MSCELTILETACSLISLLSTCNIQVWVSEGETYSINHMGVITTEDGFISYEDPNTFFRGKTIDEINLVNTGSVNLFKRCLNTCLNLTYV